MRAWASAARGRRLRLRTKIISLNRVACFRRPPVSLENVARRRGGRRKHGTRGDLTFVRSHKRPYRYVATTYNTTTITKRNAAKRSPQRTASRTIAPQSSKRVAL